MKTINKLKLMPVFLIILFTGFTMYGQFPEKYEGTYYFAVEYSGVLCGYSESVMSEVVKNGKKFISVHDDINVNLSVLGSDVETKIINNYLLDDEVKTYFSCEHEISTTASVYALTKIKNNTAFFSSERGGDFKEIELPDDVILETQVSFPHLKKDFIMGNEIEKNYQVFDDMKGEIVTKSYKLLKEEELVLNSKKYSTIVFEEISMATGVFSKLWLDKETTFPLKIEGSGRNIYLADKSIIKSIQTANMDNLLFGKVDKMISNVPEISYMKIEAKIESTGEWLTPESLNIPGQKFTGTVTNNFIEGEFEIEPLKYDGATPPPFPPNFQDEKLQKYLEPENLIESDEPVLIAEAKKITEGSEDSWEAVVKLSTWVAENIKGAVPGGTSAINTYNIREGECGSHSRLLAAFCRAVGIPARLSKGCMYSPYLGGSFGQHAWTEVYMGDAEWKAIDATAFEFDFIDAGHIRLGEMTTFFPKEMKILDYRIGDGENKTAEIPEQFQDYLGKYLFEERNSVFEILYQEGSLAVDIPGQTVLVLNDPNEMGVLYPKMTRQINLSFVKDIYGNIKELKLQQLIPLQKKSESEVVDNNIPDKLKPLLGIYELKQAQIEFTLSYKEGFLTFDDQLTKELIKMVGPNENGRWKGESDQNEISFEKNSEGEISGLVLYKNVFMPKQTELKNL
ncbi:MAG: transglutaminase domain-containing protein [Mariniphaga sp.]|nr:transglutaminase domain-containing protein [Mariniphaga sp.]